MKLRRVISCAMILSLLLCSSIFVPPAVAGSGDILETLGSGWGYPWAITLDSSGNIYVTDINPQKIVKMGPGGNVLWEKSCSSPPFGVALDAAGNVYVAVANGGIQKYNSEGTLLREFTSIGFCFGVAVDSSGNIYFADLDVKAIKSMDANGNNLTTIASGDAIKSPVALAIDSSNNLYVAASDRNYIMKMDLNGGNMTPIGSYKCPMAVATDSSGNIFVIQASVNYTGSDQVTRVDASGNNMTFLGYGWNNPQGVAVDSSGIVFVAGYANHNIVKVSPRPAYYASASTTELQPDAGETTSITLTVKNSFGDPDTSFSGDHDVTLSGYSAAPDGSFGSFNGTDLTASPNSATVTFTNGEATVDLVLNKAGAQSLEFSVADVSNPAALTITPQPLTAATMILTRDISPPEAAGGLFQSQPQITLRDMYGNTCTNDSITEITAAKYDSGDWTLTGSNMVQASAGIANYTDLGADNDGSVSGAQLVFAAGALSEITSSAVNLQARIYGANTVSASADNLNPKTGAAVSIGLTVNDSSGEVDTSFTGAHDVSLSGYSAAPDGSFGSFSGTDFTAASQTVSLSFDNGTATADLVLNNASAQTIVFSVPDVTNSVANSLIITPQLIEAPVIDAAEDDAAVDLIWDPVADASAYHIYMSTESGSYASPLAVVGSTESSYEAGGLTNGVTYYFMAAAYDAYGNQASSDEISATPQAGVASAPTLLARPGSQKVRLMWTPVEGATDYEIYMSTVSGSYGSPLETVPASVTNYDVLDLENGTMYYFTVAAMDYYGESSNSNEAMARPHHSSSGGSSDGGSSSSDDSITPNAPTEDQPKESDQPNQTETSQEFADVPENHWAFEAINQLAGQGYISGYKNGTFRPDEKITRAEFVTILVKALKLESTTSEISFSDADNHWAKESIATAAAMGISTGYADGSFKPDNLITREEIAVMSLKAAKLSEAPGETNFSDNQKISAWAKGSVLAAVNYTIIKGYPDNTFKPQGNATRAEAVSIISKILER